MSADPGKAERKILGLTLGDVTKILLACFVGFMVAKWNSSVPGLKYIVGDLVSFQGEANRIGIFAVTIENDGSKEAENVECQFALNGAKIKEVKVSPSSLHATRTFSDNEVSVSLALLNPRETLQITTLATVSEKLPDPPDVSVRAKGIIGEKRPPTHMISLSELFLVLMGVMMCGIIATAIIQGLLKWVVAFFASNKAS